MCLSRSSLSNGSGPPVPDPASCTEIDPGAVDWTGALFAGVAWPLDLMATNRGLEAMAVRRGAAGAPKERFLLAESFTRCGGTHLKYFLWEFSPICGDLSD